VELYSLAATDLHPHSMYNLGLMYLDGTSYTPKDSVQGLELITTAADLGLIEVLELYLIIHKQYIYLSWIVIIVKITYRLLSIKYTL